MITRRTISTIITTSATFKNTNSLTIHRWCDGSGVIRSFVRHYIRALHEATKFVGCDILLQPLKNHYHNDNETCENHKFPAMDIQLDKLEAVNSTEVPRNKVSSQVL